MTQKQISNWTRALFFALQGKNEEEKKEIMNRLILLLKKQKKDYVLDEIQKKLKNIFERKETINLFLSREYSGEAIEKLKKIVSESFGKEKKLVVKADQNIIGGFRAKTENFLVKASIKDFLDSLRETLKASPAKN